MKNLSVRVAVLVVMIAVFAAACGSDGGGSIDVEDARYRLAREDLGAGYLTVTNNTDDDVTLTGASAEGVGRIELHESLAADDGTMAMEARPEGFAIEAGETVSLAPGGKHLMLFDPGAGGDDLTIELDFEGEKIDVVAAFDAVASAAASEMDDMDHTDMDDGDMGDMDMEDGDMDDGAMDEDG